MGRRRDPGDLPRSGVRVGLASRGELDGGLTARGLFSCEPRALSGHQGFCASAATHASRPAPQTPGIRLWKFKIEGSPGQRRRVPYMASSLSTKEPTGRRSLERCGRSKAATGVTPSLSLYSHPTVIAEERLATRFHAWG